MPIKNALRMHENIRLAMARSGLRGEDCLYLTWARQNVPETRRLSPVRIWQSATSSARQSFPSALHGRVSSASTVVLSCTTKI